MTTEAKRLLFTIEDFHRLYELGFFDPDTRYELLDGEIYEMPAMLDPHAYCSDQLIQLFVRGLDRSILIRVNGPIRLGPRSQPLPDLTVARRPSGPAGKLHPMPADILLLVEVADSSYRRDRIQKLPRYARAGIPEYWIVNLNQRRIEVYRSPQGSDYTEVVHYGAGQTVSPATFPELVIPVADVLP